jgi:hypothetical protein
MESSYDFLIASSMVVMAITSLATVVDDEPVCSLMCVDNLRQLESRLNLIFEVRRYPKNPVSLSLYADVVNSLWWVGGVDDHCFLGFVVGN